MSVIEDSRKVMQDFLAPELRAISARLDVLEKRFEGFERRTDTRFDSFEKRVDKQFEDVERRAEKRQADLLAAINRLAEITALRERLTRLESKEIPQQ